MATIAAHPTRHVCVTGGEPLAQKACAPFVTALCDAGYDVCLETSGAYPIEGIDTRVSRIMDLKPPSSGEVDKNRWENLAQLTAHDEIKIVIASRADYVWASSVLATYPALAHTCPVWLSPAHGRQSARKLAEWLLADGLPARLQVQLHRRLWGNMVGK
jgi:7-carboxy-7-deazaguanine synthase